MWIMFNDENLFEAVSFKIMNNLMTNRAMVLAIAKNSSAELIFSSHDHSECVRFISSIADSINRGNKIVYIRDWVIE